jgi:prepilin-type N-terminal cleavage/methylation domain-containing protein
MLTRRGFSLVELVMIMIIISILSAIAAPRISGASTSARANTLLATLANVNEATQLYYAEHGRYPGHVPNSNTPDGDWFHRQMLEYSDQAGNTQDSLGYPYIFGPYLRVPFPKNPFNQLDTVRVVLTKAESVPLGSSGWIAVLATGEFRVNSSTVELEGIGVREQQVQQQMLLN